MDFKDLNILVGQLTAKQKSNPYIKHASEVQRALSMNNYHLFFDCYSNAPNMGPYIMDYFVNRERIKALMVMSKACVPHLWSWGSSPDLLVRLLHLIRYHQVPLTFLRDELAFDSVEQVVEFLADHKVPSIQNINASDEEKVWECRQAHAPLSRVFEAKYRKAKIEGAIWVPVFHLCSFVLPSPLPTLAGLFSRFQHGRNSWYRKLWSVLLIFMVLLFVTRNWFLRGFFPVRFHSLIIP